MAPQCERLFLKLVDIGFNISFFFSWDSDIWLKENNLIINLVKGKTEFDVVGK